jgi:PhnB protein
MSLTVTTHLNFRGDARAALAFYHSVFGGQQTLVTYADMGQGDRADEADQIMWGQVATDDGFRIMAFDILSPRPFDAGTSAFFISLRGTAPEEIQAHWDALSDGATILHPIGEAPWSPLYGMLTDRFGITWIIDVEQAHT